MTAISHYAVRAIALWMIGSAASAQGPQDPSAAKPAPEKKICRSLTPTGSFMATRVCNTQAQWRQFDDRNAQGTSDFRRATGMSSTNERKE